MIATQWCSGPAAAGRWLLRATRRPFAHCFETLTKAQAELVLDWLEQQGWQADVKLTDRGFVVLPRVPSVAGAEAVSR
jgi:hypothetical protein